MRNILCLRPENNGLTNFCPLIQNKCTLHRKSKTRQMTTLDHRVKTEIDTPNDAAGAPENNAPIHGNDGVHEERNQRPIFESSTHDRTKILHQLVPFEDMDGTHTSRTNSQDRAKVSPLRKLIKTTNKTMFMTDATVWSKKNFITKQYSPDRLARGAHFSLSL